jgi:hypothetical protein
MVFEQKKKKMGSINLLFVYLTFMSLNVSPLACGIPAILAVSCR